MSLFKRTKEAVETIIPSYAEVMTLMTRKESHDAFIAYEVLMCAPSEDPILSENSTRCLKNIAHSHNWNFWAFFDVIGDEYECLHVK